MARNHQYQQHFLKSTRLAAELIGHSNIRKNDTVYDLGAGSGVIAVVLARRAKRVIAIESESQVLKLLKKNTESFDNITVIREDILNTSIPQGRYKIFANIPFALSADVMRKFVFSSNPPVSTYLIVQKQFARKLVQSGQHFNSALGAMLWPWFSIKIRKPLRRSDFTPPPAVDTVLLEIKLLEEPPLSKSTQEKYCIFINQCYSRQQFFSTLPKGKIGISTERKPSELTLVEWLALFEVYN